MQYAMQVHIIHNLRRKNLKKIKNKLFVQEIYEIGIFCVGVAMHYGKWNKGAWQGWEVKVESDKLY